MLDCPFFVPVGTSTNKICGMFDAWPTVVFNSWRSFTSHVTDHLETGSQFVYRGQSDSSWQLRPTLLRLCGDKPFIEEVLRLEAEAVGEFKAQAHLHVPSGQLPGPRDTPFAWWTLMQHFGAPTRLLDWTLSPYVAAYFAVEQNPDREGVVFIVDSEATRTRLCSHFNCEADGMLNAVSSGTRTCGLRP